MSDPDLDDLAEELAEFDAPQKTGGRSAREERIVAGFEDIQRFVEEHGRPPQHGEDRDIFERLYAVRLDRVRALEECRTLLMPLDHQGLLAGATAEAEDDGLDEDDLAAELAELDADTAGITELRHVRPSEEKRARPPPASSCQSPWGASAKRAALSGFEPLERLRRRKNEERKLM